MRSTTHAQKSPVGYLTYCGMKLKGVRHPGERILWDTLLWHNFYRIKPPPRDSILYNV